MAGNSFGQAFVVSTAGESHGGGLVLIIDGCPPGLPLSPEDFGPDLLRRRPGQSRLVSARAEADEAELLSGVFEGQTTGTPIAVLVRNQDAKSKDYEALRQVFRPGHADFGYQQKYGHRDHRGGGRSSARETVCRVIAGVVAKKLIFTAFGGRVLAYTQQVGSVVAEVPRPEALTLDQVEASLVRCPDPVASAAMEALIEEVRRDQDSIGGVAEVIATGLPPGLGEPVFGKLKADLGAALLSLPAVVGLEYGSGFSAATLRGSEHNDPFTQDEDGRVVTRGNHHGGMLGGLSTGMPLKLRVALKPTSSIPRAQATLTHDHQPTEVRVKGRHDPCLLPRFIPMAEAMVAIVLADHWLRHVGQTQALTAGR